MIVFFHVWDNYSLFDGNDYSLVGLAEELLTSYAALTIYMCYKNSHKNTLDHKFKRKTNIVLLHVTKGIFVLYYKCGICHFYF